MSDFQVVPQRLVMVAWRDSSTNANWQHPPFEPDLARSLTVGWLIAEDELAVCIAASAGDSGGFGDRTSIPRSCVEWIRPVLVA